MSGVSSNKSYIYGALPQSAKDKIDHTIKDGINFIKKHPEALSTGNPEVSKEIYKDIENGVHKAVDFIKDAFKTAKEHPELLRASSKNITKVSMFDDK